MKSARSVDHICAVPRGGAFASARQLADALAAAGNAYRFWHDPREDGAGDARVQPLPWRKPRGLGWLRYRRRKVRLNRRWRRAARGAPPGREPVHPLRSSREIRFDARVFEGELLHLHWIGNAVFDWPAFFASLPAGHPVVWTQHDFHAFTGGCSYPGDCRRYVDRCEHCPLVLDPGPDDLAAEGFRWREAAFPRLNLHLVAPSKWLADCARRSAVGRRARSVHHIPYAYDLTAFAGAERASARQALGLDAADRVVCFGADSVTSRRKGARELHEALGHLACAHPVRLLVFGGGDLDTLGDRTDITALGTLSSAARLAEAYAAADVFCMPSLEDNLPLTGLEALGSGTPVVAFDGSGAVDYVRNGQTGWLARRGDGNDLARALAEALEVQRSPRGLRPDDLRTFVRAFCDPAARAAEYLSVYEEAIDAAAGAGGPGGA